MATESQNLPFPCITRLYFLLSAIVALRATYLRAYKAPLHLSRVLYKSTLFMQNKANLLDAQMNVRSLITVDYENKPLYRCGDNKPNQSQFLYHWFRSLFIIAAMC